MQREQRLKESGQATMFDLFGAEVPVPMPGLELDPVDAPPAEMLAWEKDLLGVYVSDHPFKRAYAAVSLHVNMLLSEVTAELSGREVKLAGLVSSIRPLLTRDGRNFLAVELEDLTGTLEVTVWPDVYEATREDWATGNIVLVTARVKARDERLGVGVATVRRWVEGEPLPDLPVAEAADGTPQPVAPGSNGNGRGRNGNGYNGNGKAAPPPPAVSAEERGPRLLHITIKETEDEANDRRRLAALVSEIRTHPGTDEVRVTLRTAHDEHTLSLGTALVTDGIEQRLSPILRGWGELAVSPLR